MKRGRSVLVLSACLLAAAPAAAGEAASPDWTIDTFRWAGTLAPSSSLRVRNPFGDVRLRAADAGEVEVSAMIQRPSADAAKAEVRVSRRRGRLTVEVVYPTAPQGKPHRVDLALFVPARAPVEVETRDGLIEGRGLANDVRLSSGGGDVVFATSGTARVASERGDISADLRRASWGASRWRSPRLRTRQGNITLRLPADADARVRIHAPGEVAVQRPGRFERRTARRSLLTLGSGAHPLCLKTLRGHVTLLAP